ncbi:MAG: MotA/TolQ/ExbB proton channel family protein [Gammaproteobacteria bacterium]|nr:MotA/TolQ/ExbB proton channel family protein [Gammaproteobacteria bacterium]
MWEAIRDFIELGGDILFLIGFLMIFMWVLIIERILYFAINHRQVVKKTVAAWNARPERKSWQAHRIREAMISEVRLSAQKFLGLIQASVALCPLMGLLGTVTGMVGVFEIMSILGSGNARAMADGVSKATVPTMCGMVAALSGLFISYWLQRKAQIEIQLLGEKMTMDH